MFGRRKREIQELREELDGLLADGRPAMTDAGVRGEKGRERIIDHAMNRLFDNYPSPMDLKALVARFAEEIRSQQERERLSHVYDEETAEAIQGFLATRKEGK